MVESAIWITATAILLSAGLIAYMQVRKEKKDLADWQSWKEIFVLLKKNYLMLDKLMSSRDISFSELHSIATNLVYEGLQASPGISEGQKQRFSREMIGSIIEKPLASWYVQNRKK